MINKIIVDYFDDSDEYKFTKCVMYVYDDESVALINNINRYFFLQSLESINDIYGTNEPESMCLYIYDTYVKLFVGYNKNVYYAKHDNDLRPLCNMLYAKSMLENNTSILYLNTETLCVEHKHINANILAN